MEFAQKKVLVCGMAKSGIAAALLLKEKGALVTLQDLKTAEQLGELSDFEGISLYLGKNPDEIVEAQDMLVLSPGVPIDLPFIQVAKEKGIPVLSEVELAFRLTPCPVVAITGTNGKTTTTTLAGLMLKEAYPNTAVVGNIGTPYTGEVSRLTKEDYVVAEISSFQMEAADTFAPHISAVLNISPDHLNRHKTMETYVAMKERVLLHQTKEDICILNYEDAVCRAMAEKTKAAVFFFSSVRTLSDGIYLENEHIIVNRKGIKMDVLSLSELKILGIHNYENVMAATAIALSAGVDIESIRKVLRSFMGVEHRIEYVATVGGVDYYNDSKGTNPDASIRAVCAMVKPTILIGGGYDKNSDFTPWIQTFHGKVKLLVLIGQTANQIEAACLAQGFTAILKAETFAECMTLCRQNAQPGDAVLLSPACASWGMFDNYEQRGDIFKEMVRSF